MVRLSLVLLLLAGCSPPPEQPDLNTYGALQPLCLFGCRQTFTLTEGDGDDPTTLSPTVTTSETSTRTTAN